MMKNLLFALSTIFMLTACAQESEKERPNILFCLADDASFAHFGANGCEWVNTPNFDRVAREGILFTQAYTPNAKCSPSRACIITGRNPWQLEAAANHWSYFPDKFKTVCETLRENGYETAFTGKGWGPGEYKEGRELVGKRYDIKCQTPTTGIEPTDYTASFERFLRERKQDKPFFFWYGCWEPHRPYEFQSGVDKGGKKLDMINKREIPSFWPDEEDVRHDMLDYAYEIEWFDKHLGNMLKMLEEGGLLENTMIVVTSDNGMPFPRSKGHPYELSTHMPLAIMWKGKIVKPGRTYDRLVSFIDFAPTFLEAAGVKPSQNGMEPISGKSLMGPLKNSSDTPLREVLLQGRERNDVGRPHDWGYPVRSIRKGELLYIYNFHPERWPSGNPETGFRDTGKSPTMDAVLGKGEQSTYWQACVGFRPQEELYDLDKDPDCMVNLCGNESYRGKAVELKKELFALLAKQGDPRMEGKDGYFDQFPYMNDRERGMYERVMNKKENKK